MIENFDHQKCAVGVFGCSGHGKTTLFKKIIDAQSAKYWFYYDHKGEFRKRWGLQPCFDLQGIVQQTASGCVCFDPGRMFPGRKGDGFLFFCDFVFQVSGEMAGRKIIICDELQQLAFQDDPQELITLMDDGRRREIDAFFIAQSPNQLHNMVQNQFTEIFTFRQANENATKHLVQVGFDKQALLTLKPGEWMLRDLTSGEEKRGGKAFKIKSKAKYNF